MLPKNATYGGIEYAPTPAKLQALLDELTPAQFAVLGFSAGGLVDFFFVLVVLLCVSL